MRQRLLVALGGVLGVFFLVSQVVFSAVSHPNPSVTSSTRPLQSGWNLVSLPITPSDSAIAEVLRSIAGNYRVVMKPKAGGGWDWFDPANAVASTLATLDERSGFWILMSADDSLVVTGTAPDTTAQPLANGWNLISFAAASSRDVAQALGSIAGLYTTVYGHRTGSPSNWIRFGATGPSWSNTLMQLNPGDGYWVHVTEACTLYVPYVVSPPPEAERIQPDELVYRGAFGLPDGPPEIGWEWSGEALTYYPDGDPDGPADGTPGSLFGTGHNWNQWISEISIPIPIVSPSKDLVALNTATTLQDFADIRGDLFGELELARAGLAYLPRQGAQATGKLYFCWGDHYQWDQVVSHGWCELDLSAPQVAGGWYIGNRPNYGTNDYMFDIPLAWASANTPGKLLATGRYRGGGWSGQGPSLFAIGPWNEGNPPSPGTRLEETALLLYTSSSDGEAEQHIMNNYHHSDEWSGGAWLTAGSRSAAVFVGTKGQGECWYGFANGVVWPDEPPYPPVPDPPNDERGWWSTSFAGQLLFYDPSDLAAVARGELAPHEPQPYATLDIDEHLYGIRSGRQWHHLGAAGFDREQALLYILEPRADGDKPLVHVWRVD